MCVVVSQVQLWTHCVWPCPPGTCMVIIIIILYVYYLYQAWHGLAPTEDTEISSFIFLGDFGDFCNLTCCFPIYSDLGLCLFNDCFFCEVPKTGHNHFTHISLAVMTSVFVKFCQWPCDLVSFLYFSSSYVRFDILQRILSRLSGICVIHAMVITDIDDKIIKRSWEVRRRNQWFVTCIFCASWTVISFRLLISLIL